MTELRKDPIVGRWVIISTERAKRPHEFPSEKTERKEGICPLCPGSERMTPPEILAFRPDAAFVVFGDPGATATMKAALLQPPTATTPRVARR